MDEGYTFDGTNYESFIERKRLDFDTLEATKWLGKMYPNFDAENTAATDITVEIRGQNTPGQNIDFTDNSTEVFSFNPEDTQNGYQVNTRHTGRLLNYRISSDDANEWVLSGIAFNAEAHGDR